MFECRARACSCRNENQTYKIPRKTSNFPWDYVLFANLNSTVPSYADDFKLTKYNFLFRNLPACRWVYRHAEKRMRKHPFFYEICILSIDMALPLDSSMSIITPFIVAMPSSISCLCGRFVKNLFIMISFFTPNILS